MALADLTSARATDPHAVVARNRRFGAAAGLAGAALLVLGLALAALWPPWEEAGKNPHTLAVGLPLTIGVVLVWSYWRVRRVLRVCATACATEPRSMVVDARVEPAPRGGLRARFALHDAEHAVELDWGPYIEPGTLRSWPRKCSFAATVWSSLEPGSPVVVVGASRAVVGRIKTPGMPDPGQRALRFAAWCTAAGVVVMPSAAMADSKYAWAGWLTSTGLAAGLAIHRYRRSSRPQDRRSATS